MDQHPTEGAYVREAAERVLDTWRNMPRHLRQVAVSMGLIDAKWLDYGDTGRGQDEDD